MNQNFTSLKTFWPLLIFPSLIMFIFILLLILCLHHSLIPLLLFPKAVRIYFTKSSYQLIYLLDHVKPFRRVKIEQ